MVGFIKNIKFKFVLIFSLILVVIFSAMGFKSNIKDMLCGFATNKIPIYSVDREDKKIAISFDCAWGNEYTNKLLEIMNEYNVKCTFFAVSFWAEKYKEDLKNIVKNGHEIGTHSKTHSHMSKLSSEKIREELISSKNLIKSITQTDVKLFRAPFGEYDNKLIDEANNLGLYTIQWDVDSLDWKDLSAKEIADRVLKKVKSGSIILCHNNGKHTAESLPLIFSTLIANGYKFVKISDLIYKDNYKIDNQGRQILIR